MATQCDVVVIGLGPGGEATATQLAKAGLSVVAVDERLVGGECPYFGCIPSKMIDPRERRCWPRPAGSSGLAGTAEVQPDWAPVHARIRDEATDDWDDQVAVDRLEDAGARFVRGHAPLDRRQRTVDVGDETLRGQARRRAQHRYGARRPRRSTGWRTRRTGPTATSSASSPCPAR